MSTRCTTHFMDGDITEAIVYRHTDGYPEGHGTDLYRFLEAVEEQTTDTRFTDAGYLAAKLIVWLAAQFAHDPSKPLAFLSVGIVNEDPGDIDYRYVVDCSPNLARPTIRCTDGTSNIPVPEYVPA